MLIADLHRLLTQAQRKFIEPDGWVVSPKTYGDLKLLVRDGQTTREVPSALGLNIRVSRYMPEGRVALEKNGEIVGIVEFDYETEKRSLYSPTDAL